MEYAISPAGDPRKIEKKPRITRITRIGLLDALDQGMLLEQLTRQIIGAAMEVHQALGPGFVESIYRNALSHELHLKGIAFQSEEEIRGTYKEHNVGLHRLDLVVEGRVIVELKAVSTIADAHLAQALSYMKATNIELSLIINFGGTSLIWKRLVKTRK